MNSAFKEKTISMKHCIFGYRQCCFCIMRALVDVILAIFKILYRNVDPKKCSQNLANIAVFFKWDKILLLAKREPLVTGQTCLSQIHDNMFLNIL